MDHWLFLAFVVISNKLLAECAVVPHKKFKRMEKPSDYLLSKNIEDYGPFPSRGNTLAVVKSEAVIYKNTNGAKESYEQRKEEVHKNGEVVARVLQVVDGSGDNPEPYVKTMLEIPGKNLHKVVEHGSKCRNGTAKLAFPKRNHAQEYHQNKISHRKPFSALDVAEYVFWTGDERGATAAIEELLEEGMLSRDEAITFLENVKHNLDTLKKQYAQEPNRPRIRLVPAGLVAHSHKG